MNHITRARANASKIDVRTAPPLVVRAMLATTEAELDRVIAGASADERAAAFESLARFWAGSRDRAEVAAGPLALHLQRLAGRLDAAGANVAKRVIYRVALEWAHDRADAEFGRLATIGAKNPDGKKASKKAGNKKAGKMGKNKYLKGSSRPSTVFTVGRGAAEWQIVRSSDQLCGFAGRFVWKGDAGLEARAKIHGVTLEEDGETFAAADGSTWSRKHERTLLASTLIELVARGRAELKQLFFSSNGWRSETGGSRETDDGQSRPKLVQRDAETGRFSTVAPAAARRKA